jgi:hypothetical protein
MLVPFMLASLPVAILNHDSRQMGIPHDSKQDDNALEIRGNLDAYV